MIPSKEEERYIKELRALLKRMPKSMWLFVGDSVYPMRLGKKGEHVVLGDPRSYGDGGIDPDYKLSEGIHCDCDGGDW